MEQKTCYYCGTKYPKDQDRCPLCGQQETEPEEIDEIPADLKPSAQAKQPDAEQEYRPRERKKKKKGNAFATILCILLALAVVCCALWIMNSIGMISIFRAPPQDDSSLTLPVEETPANALTGITVTPVKMQFTAAGQKNLLQVDYLMADGTPADPSVQATFESADPAIAVVSDRGEVTAVGNGTTTVTVLCDVYTATCEVNCDLEQGAVVPGAELPEQPEETPEANAAEKPEEQTEKPEETAEPAESAEAEFTLSSEDFTLFSAGEKAKITANGVPSGAEVVWSSKDASVATVEDGTVTAVGPGLTKITATCAGQTVSCIVRCRFAAGEAPVVTATADGISISHEDVTLTSPGETFKIYLLLGESGLSGVSWSTSNSSVCSVDADGTVHANGSGMAKIVGSYNGNSYSCIVRCRF